MSIKILPTAHRELLDACISWHVRPYKKVFLEALASISAPLRFDDLKTLEIGAEGKSILSTFLVARGAHATVTCYTSSELVPLTAAIAGTGHKYGLPMERFDVGQADILALNPEPKFDLILMKGVLGGISRMHELQTFQTAVDNCLSALTPNGRLLIIDKARSLHIINWMLRHFGAAGKRGYHYFTNDELASIIARNGLVTEFAASGVASFGDFRTGLMQNMMDFWQWVRRDGVSTRFATDGTANFVSLSGGMLQYLADFMDAACLEKIVPDQHRVVFSLICAKRQASRPHDSLLTK
jgi:hypothetical protein